VVGRNNIFGFFYDAIQFLDFILLFEEEATTKNTKDTKKNKNYGFFVSFVVASF